MSKSHSKQWPSHHYLIAQESVTRTLFLHSGVTVYTRCTNKRGK
jgi:hypothetical protein